MIGIVLFAALASQPQPAVEEPQEIVVTGTRLTGCRVQLADRTLSNRQLAARARQWAVQGKPVRVVHPAGAGYDCLARIAFRLNRYGVRLIQFVDRPDPVRPRL